MEGSKPPSPRKDAGLQSGGGHKPPAAGPLDPMAHLQHWLQNTTALASPDHTFGTAKRCAPRSSQWQAVACRRGIRLRKKGWNKSWSNLANKIMSVPLARDWHVMRIFCMRYQYLPASDFPNSPNSLPPSFVQWYPVSSSLLDLSVQRSSHPAAVCLFVLTLSASIHAIHTSHP